MNSVHEHRDYNKRESGKMVFYTHFTHRTMMPVGPMDACLHARSKHTRPSVIYFPLYDVHLRFPEVISRTHHIQFITAVKLYRSHMKQTYSPTGRTFLTSTSKSFAALNAFFKFLAPSRFKCLRTELYTGHATFVHKISYLRKNAFHNIRSTAVSWCFCVTFCFVQGPPTG